MIVFAILLCMSPICFPGCDGAKILGISWIATNSHQTFFNSIWKELSIRGHEVTAMTAFPFRNASLTNLTEIDVSYLVEIFKQSDVSSYFNKDNYFWDSLRLVKHFHEETVDSLLNIAEVKELINSDAEFDLVIAEVHASIVYAFGERFKAPVIGLTSTLVSLEIHDLHGNPTHPLISLDYNLPFETSALEHPYSVRIKTFLFQIWSRIVYYWYFLPRYDKIVKKHFGNHFPSMRNILQHYPSILLINTNLVTSSVRANVPSVIEVNQIHIRENRALPKDLQNFLDSSKSGAVYFSLGATVQTSELKNETINEIVQAFSQLPYNVLWKYEKDNIPNVSSNVLVRKFFPQQDVLAHPNIKVFVTQGGMQSIEEAISREVPMVGIPLIADQPINIKRLVDMGLAAKLNSSKIQKEAIVEAILEVSENQSYRKRVKEFKAILEDEPLKGIDKAIWWIEYVIRHKGAKHLRSPSADMNFFQYFMLDVIFLLILILLVILFVLYKTVIFFTYSSYFRRKVKEE